MLSRPRVEQRILHVTISYMISYHPKQLVRDGMGDKLAIGIMSASLFVGNISLAFASSWKLTLVMLCALPVILFSFIVSNIVSSFLTKGSLYFLYSVQKCRKINCEL